MNKFELIEAIREFNRTAAVDFLSQFDEDELEKYLLHLRETQPKTKILTSPSLPFH